MKILGINSFHGDASAALIIDGKLIAAVEEERFNRIKHWAGFPENSIRCVLKLGGIDVQQLDAVALSFNPRAHFFKRALHAAKIWRNKKNLGGRLQRLQKALHLADEIARVGQTSRKNCKFKIFPIEHHETHIAAGFWPSPFEEAAILSIDGMGDFLSTVLSVGKKDRWQRLHQVGFPHSLGFLYTAITLFLGFPNYGDEYKVMGLAPYGKPRYLDLFRKIIAREGLGFRLNLDYFIHHKLGIDMSWIDGSPVIRPFHSAKLEEALGKPRSQNEPLTDHHQDIAASLQAITEEILLGMLTDLRKKTQQRNLCISGGVAMNSVANGKVREQTGFENVYVPVGAADNGTAIGAAFVVWKQHGGSRVFQLDHGYWGPDVEDQLCLQACQNANVEYQKLPVDEMNQKIADALIDGKVVGVFRGRMEFGARALGNRSLLADPRRADMRDLINLKIKFREKFRPFAPSILEEYTHEYFELPEPSPFMERVLRVRPEKRSQIPAVTHVDGTGRLQTVSYKTNPIYWSLIECFRQKTGVPIVLNTSLNENEPIVNTPQEALSCFLRTRMDAIVLGNFWVERK
ncbi:MAG: hypothetical protein NZM04_10810 [Methylacidiphilales bacterium]|nr:hypothetical protein [Candidatus Methylacidiphilales bacterium]MDW8349116.1 carbamoyltransferase C-terminal domain-containing protein [Verrucomicrobiae bacterium]